MARVTIDNTRNMWPGTTSIADLAANTPLIRDRQSSEISVYDVEDALLAEWKPEIEPGTMESEFPNWCRVDFKDGSRITVSAWKWVNLDDYN
jgi:hypothetical protein